MIDRKDFEKRIGLAIYMGNHKVHHRRRVVQPWDKYGEMAKALLSGKQVAEALPGLFRSEDIDL